MQDILSSVQIYDECDDENMYFAPNYVKYLTRTFVRMPLWSNIMLNTFGSDNKAATSTPVENTFKEIKSLLRINVKRRIDIFLRKHLESLYGLLKQIISDQLTAPKNSEIADVHPRKIIQRKIMNFRMQDVSKKVFRVES